MDHERAGPTRAWGDERLGLYLNRRSESEPCLPTRKLRLNSRISLGLRVTDTGVWVGIAKGRWEIDSRAAPERPPGVTPGFPWASSWSRSGAATWWTPREQPRGRLSAAAVELVSRYLRMLTARATTMIARSRLAADSTSMSIFAQRLKGIASVGLNAVAFVNDK